MTSNIRQSINSKYKQRQPARTRELLCSAVSTATRRTSTTSISQTFRHSHPLHSSYKRHVYLYSTTNRNAWRFQVITGNYRYYSSDTSAYYTTSDDECQLIYLHTAVTNVTWPTTAGCYAKSYISLGVWPQTKNVSHVHCLLMWRKWALEGVGKLALYRQSLIHVAKKDNHVKKAVNIGMNGFIKLI